MTVRKVQARSFADIDLKAEKDLQTIMQQGLNIGMHPLEILAHANTYKRGMSACNRAMFKFEQSCASIMPEK